MPSCTLFLAYWGLGLLKGHFPLPSSCAFSSFILIDLGWVWVRVGWGWGAARVEQQHCDPGSCALEEEAGVRKIQGRSAAAPSQPPAPNQPPKPQK